MVNRNSVYYKAIYLTENINVKLITLLDLGKKIVATVPQACTVYGTINVFTNNLPNHS